MSPSTGPDAAARGARLVLFPEAFLCGYPKGEDFGARVGSRTPEALEQLIAGLYPGR